MKKTILALLTLIVIIVLIALSSAESTPEKILCVYNKAKAVSVYSFADANSNLVVGEYGYASAECKYANRKKWPEKIRYLDVQGKRNNTTNGFAVIKYSYDGNNRVTRITFYNAKGNLINTLNGYSQLAVYYSEKGIERVSAFNTKDKKLDINAMDDVCLYIDNEGHPVVLGMPQIDIKESPKLINKESEEIIIDKPTNTPVTTKQPKNTPKPTEYKAIETYTPAPATHTPTPTQNPTPEPTKTPVITEEPIKTPVITKTPEPTATVTPSPTPSPTPTPTPVPTSTPSPTPEPMPELKEKWIEDGNVLRQTYYDALNNPVEGELGFVTRIQEYSDKKVIAEYYLDASNNPVPAKGDVYYRVEYTYDKLGNINREKYYNNENEPVLSVKGYSIVYREYDEYQHIVYEKFYGTDGFAIIMPDGSVSHRYKYNQKDEITEIKKYDYYDHEIE